MSTFSNNSIRLLIVDDDTLVIDSLRLVLPKHWQLTATSDPKRLPDARQFHAAFVDMHLTGNLSHAEGPQVIESLSKSNPKLEIVAISGDLSMELMEDCLNRGAKKFLAKPLMRDEVLSVLEKIEALCQMREAETRGYKGLKWIGSSSASESIKQNIASMRGEPGPILLEGETGTGKEVVCQLLNQQEIQRPLVTVNIAAIPENLFESEIFGHVKGSFTGADSLKVGLAEAANGGELFFDEIEALPLSQQVKLLRFLESGEVRRVGAKESIKINCRVIVASNQPLVQMVKEGRFREDLYFRLSSRKITLPPLRQRLEDITELAKYFLAMEKPRSNKMLSPDAVKALQEYNWPGNVRELKRICEQVSLISPLPIIRREDISSLIQPGQRNDFNQAIDFSVGLTKLVEAYESFVILQCLKQQPDVEQAAQLLQVSRSSLYKKIKDYGIESA